MERDYIQPTYNFGLEDHFMMEDLENRHLYINEAISEDVISSVVYHILRFNLEDQEVPVEERMPIILYINSPGGDIVAGFGVIDAILTSKTPVYTVNLGECSSMGFLIFIAGAKRFAMPHCEFLMHDGSSGGADSMAKLRDRIEFETGELAGEIKEYVISRTKIDKKTYDKKYRIEWYFMAKDAVELGVADHIIGKDCSMDDIL